MSLNPSSRHHHRRRHRRRCKVIDAIRGSDSRLRWQSGRAATRLNGNVSKRRSGIALLQHTFLCRYCFPLESPKRFASLWEDLKVPLLLFFLGRRRGDGESNSALTLWVRILLSHGGRLSPGCVGMVHQLLSFLGM